MKVKRSMLAGMVVAGVFGTSHAFAHHSYAQFDRCVSVTITGQVRSADYSNPHIVLDVETRVGEIYRVEWMSLQALSRSGLEPDVVAVGDQVEITGSRHRDPETYVLTLLREFVRPSDGWSWQLPGNRSDPPAACSE